MLTPPAHWCSAWRGTRRPARLVPAWRGQGRAATPVAVRACCPVERRKTSMMTCESQYILFNAPCPVLAPPQQPAPARETELVMFASLSASLILRGGLAVIAGMAALARLGAKVWPTREAAPQRDGRRAAMHSGRLAAGRLVRGPGHRDHEAACRADMASPFYGCTLARAWRPLCARSEHRRQRGLRRSLRTSGPED
jgi:hypothetical protein